MYDNVRQCTTMFDKGLFGSSSLRDEPSFMRFCGVARENEFSKKGKRILLCLKLSFTLFLIALKKDLIKIENFAYLE